MPLPGTTDVPPRLKVFTKCMQGKTLILKDRGKAQEKEDPAASRYEWQHTISFDVSPVLFWKCGDLEDCPMQGERGQTVPHPTQPQDCHDPEHAAGKLSGVSSDRQTGTSHSGREGFPSLLLFGLPLSCQSSPYQQLFHPWSLQPDPKCTLSW